VLEGLWFRDVILTKQNLFSQINNNNKNEEVDPLQHQLYQTDLTTMDQVI